MYVRLLTFYESQLQTQVLQGQLDAQNRRIAGIESFQKQTDEMRHEFKNMLFTLNIDMERENYVQAKMRTRELLGNLKQAAPEPSTGNSLIDAVIAYKAARIRETGADIDVRADLLDIESAAAYDIASIMGIAMDNVIDACEQLREKDAPVHIAIQKQKNLIQIQVANPLPGPLRYKNGEIQSTKAGSGHGLGLSALRRVAQKYNGEVTVEDTDGTFSLSVMLFL
jgi:sensor histidine kinase regulating citrate/malate metabolism